jgi:multimeric flavodoxin WrbA
MTDKRSDGLVILASSRNRGNTRLLADWLAAGRSFPIIDLSSKSISYYDYGHANAGDDFIPLIETLSAKSLWILATPVYWYTVSAQLKTFMDRLTDLLETHKELGRTLRGRSVALLVSGTESQLLEGFESPVRLTCNYLGMNYLGACYGQFEGDGVPNPSVRAAVEAFGSKLLNIES